MPQIKNRVIFNHPVFCVFMTIAEKSLTANLNESWRADLAYSAFGKIAVVYGHIDENGPAVRKRPARKMAITDKMGKNGRLSVNLDEILSEMVEQSRFQKSSFSRPFLLLIKNGRGKTRPFVILIQAL